MTISKLKFFLIWGTISFIIMAMEWLFQYYFHILNLTPLYFEFLFLLTFMGLYIFRAIASNNPIKRENIDIAIQLNAIMDNELSKRYTALTEPLTHLPVEIFKFPTLDRRHRSPAFTPLTRKPAIFIHENLFNTLDDNEREALVLHEIHHFIKKDALKAYILAISILIFGGLFLFASVVSLLSGLHFFILIFAIVALLGIVIAMLLLKIHLVFSEISADKFAAQYIGTNIPVISALKKTVEIDIQNYPDKKKRYNSIYQRRKASLEKKKYLNGADESNIPK